MLRYRKANSEDIEELIRLRLEFLKEVGNVPEGSKDDDLKKVLYDYFNAAMLREEFVAWLAMEDDDIIGTSGLSFYTLPPSYKNPTGKVAYIMNMYTIPAYRKNGTAKLLFEKILEEAKQKGYSYISLHATEKGRPLYLKFGFKDLNTEMTLKI